MITEPVLYISVNIISIHFKMVKFMTSDLLYNVYVYAARLFQFSVV